MDVARDLLDRQLTGPDGRECGRVDDLWLEWNADGAQLGALESGAATVLAQLGVAGSLLRRLGGDRARRARAIEWSDVVRVDRTQVVLARVPPEGGPLRPAEPGRRRYSAISRLAVVDAGGERRTVLDIRTKNAGSGAGPAVLGLIACRHPWLRTLGMKRYDPSGAPLADVQRHARWVPWGAIAELGDEIHLAHTFDGFPRLGDAPDPGPPPRPPSEPEQS